MVTGAPQAVAAYWAAAQARDWAAFGALVAADIVYEAPQTRERVRGREAYVRFNSEGFDREWDLAVERIVGGGRSAASWIQFTEPDGRGTGSAPRKLASGPAGRRLPRVFLVTG